MHDDYYLSEYPFIPYDAREALEDNPRLGICVIFKKNSESKQWLTAQFRCEDYSFYKLNKMMLEDRYDYYFHDFVMLDDKGNVFYSNCDATITCTEKGLIIVNDNEYMIKAVNDKTFPVYVGGKNKEEMIKELEKNLMYKKKHKKKMKMFKQSKIVRF